MEPEEPTREPSWGWDVAEALHRALQEGAVVAGAKHLALEGTDLQILLACPFFYSAPDTDAFLTSIRGAVQAQCGQAYYATVDYPRSKVPHMRVVFYATPAALHVKRQLAAESEGIMHSRGMTGVTGADGAAAHICVAA